MLEQLELTLSGCVGKSALKSDRVNSLDEIWQTLKQKVVLTEVIWHLGDVPSKVVEKLESLADNYYCYYYDYYDYEYYY